MVDHDQIRNAFVAKCLADSGFSANPSLTEKVTAVFRKAGKRGITATLQAELGALGIPTSPRLISHEEVVRVAVAAREVTTLSRCANAFVAGLAIDLIALRAPLRAYCVVAHFPDHPLATPDKCRVCGYAGRLLFYPGVTLSGVSACGIHGRVNDAYVAAQTLNWFATLPPITPSPSQVARFESVLDIVAKASATATCNSLRKDLSGPLGGDKDSRGYVLETLGYCGVLNTKQGEPLLDKWVNRDAIQEHPHKFNEAESPACYWKREFGFNGARFRELFPGAVLPAELDGPML